jgi:putative transposase
MRIKSRENQEFVADIKEGFLKGKQPDKELPALRDIRNRPGLDDLEHVVNSVLESDEKLARQVKLYLCHRYSGKKLREIAERFDMRQIRGNSGESKNPVKEEE